MTGKHGRTISSLSGRTKTRPEADSGKLTGPQAPGHARLPADPGRLRPMDGVPSLAEPSGTASA